MIFKIFFIAATRLILEKNILAIFRVIFQKNWHSHVIIPIVAILKIFSTIFFVTLQSMAVLNSCQKQYAVCPSPPPPALPWAWSEKNTPRQVGLKLAADLMQA